VRGEPPPEVELDERGRQVLTPPGREPSHPQFRLCAGGCGYMAGADASDEEAWHPSCRERVTPK
jgi:hypothetical protein